MLVTTNTKQTGAQVPLTYPRRERTAKIAFRSYPDQIPIVCVTMNDRRKSNLYDRCVAAWAIDEFDFVDVTVTANGKVRGYINDHCTERGRRGERWR